MSEKSNKKYRVKNWSEYNKNLCKRGSLTVFLTDDVIKEWKAIEPKKKVVGEKTYPDTIIECCQRIKNQFHLRLRQAQGFIGSIFSLMPALGEISVPDYSTLCRRQDGLPVEVSKRLANGENLHIGIDSTGLKVYGEGEWKVRKHGWSKHRTWMKMSICMDLDTQEILAVELTGNDEADAPVAKKILEGKTKNIESFSGDGAYDDFCFREFLGNEVNQIIPPPKNAVTHPEIENDPKMAYLKQRNDAVNTIHETSRDEWKEKSGYHKRSLNEVVMYRYKTIFGEKLSARKTKNQETEVQLNCKLLNVYCDLGMPVSYKVD
ncbi:IS5 family transposase [Spirochaetia bacterium]|nr:IS5 family transposase [Spirochaetia bacterium]